MKLGERKLYFEGFCVGVILGIMFMCFFMGRPFEEKKLKDLFKWQADYAILEYMKEMNSAYPMIPSGSPVDQRYNNGDVPTASYY